jgi:hypothetical protein
LELLGSNYFGYAIGYKMIYLIYIFLIPVSLVLTLIAVLIAPVLPLFAKNIYGWCDNHSYEAIEPRLPSWLNWFMTPDNSLEGDNAFKNLNPPSYKSQVKWLWRNPAYSFALKYLHAPYSVSTKGDTSIKDNDNAKAGWCFVRANKLFQFRLVLPIGFSRCIYCNFGWNVIGLADPNINPKPDPWQATFVFSPRISGYR